MDWTPPGKNCGLCGARTCEVFMEMVAAGERSLADCPFSEAGSCISVHDAVYTGRDILGNAYDFVIDPLPGEPTVRKIVLPFRPDLVERRGIAEGEIVVGRPMGAGCPVQHVIRVIEADPITGVITGHVVGPAFSRDREYHDVRAYHMLGFEGLATHISSPPVFGKRQRFLPGFCMMALAHTGLVNMIVERSEGVHVRVEDVII
ncbi:putative Fe-S cluster-containing protein [Methanofollis sp. W23]|uniref:(Fe-S)-binding protein n=1 Tax=Methanofollis sp. W23 TaxID=2817849 RepID=UPI001AE272FF|nr:(Fe-S)-binding protein [Methanofollis sp. W23]MBP2146926.1 putative Fe-S cluster-containing protein [Methanofollis sp. W23]